MTDKLTLTYLNIRQSISILLAKLVFWDLLMASMVIFFYSAIIGGGEFAQIALNDGALFISVFGFLGIVKILIDTYVILKWLNEYYEITPEFIVHRSGIIFRKKEQYKLENVREMIVQDSLLGQFLNFGTIILYDIRLHKYLEMYLIHNPERYAGVLKTLKPDIEIQRENTYIPLVLPQKSNGIEKKVVLFEKNTPTYS